MNETDLGDDNNWIEPGSKTSSNFDQYGMEYYGIPIASWKKPLSYLYQITEYKTRRSRQPIRAIGRTFPNRKRGTYDLIVYVKYDSPIKIPNPHYFEIAGISPRIWGYKASEQWFHWVLKSMGRIAQGWSNRSDYIEGEDDIMFFEKNTPDRDLNNKSNLNFRDDTETDNSYSEGHKKIVTPAKPAPIRSLINDSDLVYEYFDRRDLEPLDNASQSKTKKKSSRRSRSPKRKQKRSESPKSKNKRPDKLSTRHRSPKRKRERSESPKRKRERSESPKRKRERSESPKRKRERSESPKRKRERSESPKRKRERSESPKRKRERSESPKRKRERSESPKRKRERSESPKRKRERSESPKRKRERSESPKRKRERSESPKRKRERSDDYGKRLNHQSSVEEEDRPYHEVSNNRPPDSGREIPSDEEFLGEEQSDEEDPNPFISKVIATSQVTISDQEDKSEDIHKQDKKKTSKMTKDSVSTKPDPKTRSSSGKKKFTPSRESKDESSIEFDEHIPNVITESNPRLINPEFLPEDDIIRVNYHQDELPRGTVEKMSPKSSFNNDMTKRRNFNLSNNIIRCFRSDIHKILYGPGDFGKTSLAKFMLDYECVVVEQIEDLNNYDPNIHRGIIFENMDFSSVHYTVIASLLMKEDRIITMKKGDITLPASVKLIFITEHQDGRLFGDYDINSFLYDQCITLSVNGKTYVMSRPQRSLVAYP